MQIIDQPAPPLFPVVQLLRAAWKTVLAGGFCGAVFAAGYLAVTPPQYEATALISMAQISAAGNVGNSGALAIINIEDPAFLIERLKVPSTYTSEAIAACEADQAGMPAEEMAGLVRAIMPRSAGAVILIKTRRESPQLATQCVSALFEMIRSQQAAMVMPVEEDLRGTLADLEARLSAKQSDLEKAERQGQGQYQSIFLAKRDELLFLNQQIYMLHRAIRTITPTTLTAPVYTRTNPVAPQRSLVLIAATLAGLFIGLLLAAAVHNIANGRMDAGRGSV